MQEELAAMEQAADVPRDVGAEQESMPPEQEEGGGSAEDMQTRERARTLYDQAMRIQREDGMDILAMYRDNEKVQRKVLSGEWDFQDVKEAYVRETGGSRQQVPKAVSSPNHAQTRRSFMSMSEKELDDFNERLERGEKIDARR